MLQTFLHQIDAHRNERELPRPGYAGGAAPQHRGTLPAERKVESMELRLKIDSQEIAAWHDRIIAQGCQACGQKWEPTTDRWGRTFRTLMHRPTCAFLAVQDAEAAAQEKVENG